MQTHYEALLLGMKQRLEFAELKVQALEEQLRLERIAK
jgi:hypothetical protein